MRMKRRDLLPHVVRRSLPGLGATEHEKDPLVRVKFFYPDFSWTWYAIEFDGDDLFFGLVDGFERELGYFRLSELMRTRGRMGMEIERDRSFTPTPLSVLLPNRSGDA
jgi:hypothetical protein